MGGTASAAAAAATFAGRRAQQLQLQQAWASAVMSALRSERAAVSPRHSPCMLQGNTLLSHDCDPTVTQQGGLTVCLCPARCPLPPLQWAVQNAVGALFAAVFAVVIDLQFSLACLVGVLYRQVGTSCASRASRQCAACCHACKK